MKEVVSVLFMCVGLIGAFSLGLFNGMTIGYKQGQIDALSGRSIEYHLVTNDNISVTWERIEDE